MANVLKFKQPDGSVKFTVPAPVYTHNIKKTGHASGDTMHLRIPLKMLGMAHVHAGDTCQVTIKKLTTVTVTKQRRHSNCSDLLISENKPLVEIIPQSVELFPQVDIL